MAPHFIPLAAKFSRICPTPVANGAGWRSSNVTDGDQAMKTRQAWVWLAAGVLALGLNGFYLDGGAAWAHRIMDGAFERVAARSRVFGDFASARAVVELASVRFDRFVEKANVVAMRDENASCPLAAAMARFHAGVARAGVTHLEAMPGRDEAAQARAEANQARNEARLEVNQARMEARVEADQVRAEAREEANQARIEARSARARMVPVVFNSLAVPVVCPRMRVTVPRVSVQRLPM